MRYRHSSLFLLLLFSGCFYKGTEMNEKKFFNVLSPSYSESDCSPGLADDFNGLLIAMPKKIDLSEHQEMPICASFRVSSDLVSQARGKLIEHTVIVFVNREAGRSLSLNLEPDKEPIDHEDGVLDVASDERGDSYVVNMYFNIDVFNFFPDFPRHKADYLVYATVLNVRSNAIETSILHSD